MPQIRRFRVVLEGLPDWRAGELPGNTSRYALLCYHASCHKQHITHPTGYLPTAFPTDLSF